MMEYGEGLLFKRVSTSYNKFIATYNDKLFIGNGTDVRELFVSTATPQLLMYKISGRFGGKKSGCFIAKV